MFHLVWYILIGLVSGVVAKSVMHVHITMFWTIVLGIIGSIIGGGVTHVLFRPKSARYHPAGLIFSTLGAILVLYICYKLKFIFPRYSLTFRENDEFFVSQRDLPLEGMYILRVLDCPLDQPVGPDQPDNQTKGHSNKAKGAHEQQNQEKNVPPSVAFTRGSVFLSQ